MGNKNEEEFDVFLSEKFLTGKNSGSKTITKSKGEVIVKMLKGGDGKDPKLKFWIKNKGFRLMDYPALGLKDVLCLPAKKTVSK